MTHWIIDGVVLFILLVALLRGRRAGFIPGIFMLLGLLVAVYGANLVAETYSGEFTGMLEPFISGLTDRVSREAEAEFEKKGVTADTRKMVEKTLSGMGIIGTAKENITEEICRETKATGHELRTLLTEKLCSCAAYILTAIIAFILISIVFTVLINLINLSFHMPGFEIVDGVLGACFGIAEGLVIVFFILWLLRFTGLLISEDKLEGTRLVKKLIELNPLPGYMKL